MNSTRPKQIAVALALLLGIGAAPLAFAQYIWLNEKGVKQFSDMPPPASVPKNRIIKSPAGSPLPPAMNSDQPPTDAPAPEGAKKDKGPMTTAERNADFQKRQKEQAEKDKKAADAQQAAADKAKNCEQARNYARTLESGERVTKMDKSGEKVYLTDEQRSQDMREAKNRLAGC